MRPLTIILVVIMAAFILISCSPRLGNAVLKKNLPHQIAHSAAGSTAGLFTQKDLYKLVRNVTYQLNAYKKMANKRGVYIGSTPHLFGENIFIKFRTDSNLYSIKLHLNYLASKPSYYLGYFILSVSGKNFSFTAVDDNFSGKIQKAQYHYNSKKGSLNKVYDAEKKFGLQHKSFFKDLFGLHLYIIYRFISKKLEEKTPQV